MRAALVLSILMAAIPAGAEVRECVGPDGHTVFTNDYCPSGYSLKSSEGEFYRDKARGTVSPASSPGRPAASSAQSMPPAVMSRVRAQIESRYPDNYSMQKILIDAQIKAYSFLASYSPAGVPTDTLSSVRAEIVGRYPDNYTMQKILIEAQVKAYLELNR